MSKADDKRLTTDELDELRRSGASPELLTIVRRDPETVGHKRNSAREAARKVLRRDYDTDEDLRAALDLHGGHYFSALFNGEVAEAFYRADIANTRLLLDTFGRDYLIERLIADDNRPPESAARFVDERIEEYGDGILP